MVPDILHHPREVRPVARSSFCSASPFHHDARPRLHSQHASDTRSGGTSRPDRILHVELPECRLQTRRSRTPGFWTSFFDLGKYVHLQGLPSALDLHFGVMPVLVCIPNTHWTEAWTRAQQGCAGLSRLDRSLHSEIKRNSTSSSCCCSRRPVRFRFQFCTPVDGITGYPECANAIPTQLVRRDYSFLRPSSAIAPVQSGRTFRCALRVACHPLDEVRHDLL